MYEAYNEQLVYLRERLAEITATTPIDGSTLQDTTFATQQHNLQARLPKLDIEPFDGSVIKWRAFSDQFTTTIGKMEIEGAFKLQYLKRSVTGEAARLIASFSITDVNFIQAWDKLVAKYENKRILVETHLETLFTLKKLQQASAKGLFNLIATATETLAALKGLGAPTDNGDLIIVHLLTRCLDPDTYEAWALNQGSSLVPSDLKTFTDFLEARLSALETIDRHTKIKTQQTSSKAKTHATISSSPVIVMSHTCPICAATHKLFQCPEFSQKSASNRKETVRKLQIWFNCFGNRAIKDCRSKGTCRTCQKKHNTLLHDSFSRSQGLSIQPGLPGAGSSAHTLPAPLTSTPTNPIPPVDPGAATVNHAVPQFNSRTNVLLATAIITVQGDNVKHQLRALIDPGSEVSFISERMVQLLKLRRSAAATNLLGVGATPLSSTTGMVTLPILTANTHQIICSVNAYILSKLTSLLPSFTPKSTTWPHLYGLSLSDPSYHVPGRIDMILGADIYADIVLPGVRKGPPDTPIAQSTVFGWILSGSTQANSSVNSACIHFCSADSENLNLQLQAFWNQEELLDAHPNTLLSPEEAICEEHFKRTHTRTDTSQYVVCIPLKEAPQALGDSRATAMRVLLSQNRRMNNNPEYRQLYEEFLQDYKKRNHMSLVPADHQTSAQPYYLPHHGVLRPSSTTTRLRVVFNGSAKSSSGKSLNDIVYTGQKLQVNLPDVLQTFRRHRYVVCADVKQMYRQVLVHPNDWNLQRILWWKNDQIVEYHLRTVTYGEACAPYLALRAFNQLVQDEGHKFPLAVRMLTSGRYVDDEFGGAESIKKCEAIVNQAIAHCAAGNFTLQKWSSNHQDILAHLDSSQLATEPEIAIDSTTIIRTLGLCWNPTTDTFKFQMNFQPLENLTKRTALSRIAQLFDPLGFLTPITITAKIFMQSLWLNKLN